MKYSFKSRAFKQLQKLPREVQIQIIKKVDYFCTQDDPLQFSEPLVRGELGSYRFRIGDYQVIFDLDDEGVVILLVGHRKAIYR